MSQAESNYVSLQHTGWVPLTPLNRKVLAMSRDTPPPANSRQVGGDHYRKGLTAGGEQHWDMIYRLYGHGYFVGCVTKYVLRYRDKNGVEDLEKARHYLDKLIELERAAADARQADPPAVNPGEEKKGSADDTPASPPGLV